MPSNGGYAGEDHDTRILVEEITEIGPEDDLSLSSSGHCHYDEESSFEEVNSYQVGFIVELAKLTNKGWADALLNCFTQAFSSCETHLQELNSV